MNRSDEKCSFSVAKRVKGCQFLVRHFDLNNCDLLFQKLIYHGLASLLVHFLSFWYRDQQMSVHWNKSYSDSFCVPNGVRQDSVLSPILYTYIHGWVARFV